LHTSKKFEFISLKISLLPFKKIFQYYSVASCCISSLFPESKMKLK